MSRYNLYQINLRPLGNEVNRLGWAEAYNTYLQVRAYLATSNDGSENFEPEFFEHYNLVARIEGEDLNDVFEFGNIGPEENIERLLPMHSVSVGDIIELDGVYSIVDPIGFAPITAKIPVNGSNDNA